MHLPMMDEMMDGRALWDAFPEAVFQSDRTGRIQRENAAARRQARAGQGCFLQEILPDTFAREFQQACASGEAKTAAFFWPLQEAWTEAQIVPAGPSVSVILRDITTRVAAERELEGRAAHFRAMMEQCGVGIWQINPQRGTLYCNPAMCVLLEAESQNDVIQRDYRAFFTPESLETLEREHQKRRQGQASSYEADLRGLCGGRRRVMISGAPIFSPEGHLESILGTFTDLSARHDAEQARRQAEEKYRSIFENAVEGLFQTRPDGKILSANPALARMQGYGSPEEMIADINHAGRQVYVAPNRRSQFLRQVETQGAVTNFESQIYCKDGQIIWIGENIRAIRDSAGTLLYYEGSAIDITAHKTLERERETLLNEAMQRAERCAVTGLLNHRAFHRRLREETQTARESGRRLAVVALDMDNFKFFNDTYGHLTGDDVLRRVADVLRAHCRAADSPARIGGDEFALLMPGLSQKEAEAVAARLAQSLAREGYCPPGADRPVPLSVSAGVATFPEAGAEGTDALHRADIHLLASKRGASPQKSNRENVTPACLLPALSSDACAMLDGLLEAVDAKDRQTRCHSENVVTYSLRLAQRLGLAETAKQTLAVAALMHDLGKIGVPDRVLRKPGTLSAEEREIIQRHPALGAALVGAAPGLADAPGSAEILAAIRHHHERWDGLGYPDRLHAEAIPILARILAVAEAFVTMTAERPYALRLTASEACEALRLGAGTQWDPECIGAFLVANATDQRQAV